jgi:broad specificity phosphatase PhoE
VAEPTTLYLARHGETDRPPAADFDLAVLTERGVQQVHDLGLRWTLPIPDLIYCSPLPRSIETGSVLAKVFRRPIKTVHGLEEWAATEKDVSQDVYRATERKCWADFDYENDDGESLNEATQRIIHHLAEIARVHPRRPVMVAGHAILFALFFGHIRGERATEESKDRIKFADWAVVEHRSRWHIVRDFGP